MDKFSRSIDEQIKQAIQKGKFDDLPGKGKPFEVSYNPHENPAWSMAFSMLKSGGHTLPWIETRQTIEKKFEAAQKSLARTWNWRKTALAENQSYQLVTEEWQRALAKFKEKITNLNQRISDYNLEVPSDQFKRLKINIDREIEKITNSSD